MPLNFSYITSHQPIYNGGIWIIDIHRFFQRLLYVSLLYSLYTLYTGRHLRIRNDIFRTHRRILARLYLEWERERGIVKEKSRWRMLRFHDAHTSRYAADLMWTRYEPITCATLWTVLWFAVSRLNSNIGNSLALPFAIVFVTGGERMRACVQMDTRIRSIALRFPDKLIPNISESLSIYDSSPIRKRSFCPTEENIERWRERISSPRSGDRASMIRKGERGSNYKYKIYIYRVTNRP